MLNETISDFMEVMYPAERYALLEEIILFLEAGPNESIQEDIEALMFSPGEASMRDERHDVEGDVDVNVKSDLSVKSEDVIRDQISEYLNTAVVTDLRGFGIEVAPDATLNQIFTVLKGISGLENYEDVATLIQVASIDTDNIERLAQILEIVTLESADNLCCVIDSVSDDLIRGILKLSVTRADNAYEELESDNMKRFLMRIRAYREYTQNAGFETLKIWEYIPSIVMGSDLDVYLDSGVFTELIENNNIEKLAIEMYGLTLVSAQSEDPLTAIRDVAEKYLSDTVRTSQLNSEVIRINGGYAKFLQEAINRDRMGGMLNG